jgi:hypothetical protein
MVYTTFEVITPDTFNLTYCRQVMVLHSFHFIYVLVLFQHLNRVNSMLISNGWVNALYHYVEIHNII